MSSAINVYAVPLDLLTKLLGSRDAQLIADVLACRADHLESVDDIDDEAGTTCADAVAQLINDEVDEDVPAYLYGYALENICATVGEELDNICPISGASDWIDDVDATLKSLGIPLELSDLVFGGCPVAIPDPDESPSIGHWPAATVTAAANAFVAVDLAGLDDDMRETIDQLRGWVTQAAKAPGSSIVGFLS